MSRLSTPANRPPLADLLRTYRESDRCFEEEAETVVRMLDFLEHDPQCFERQQLQRHFTASAWVFNHDGSAFLLTHHRKLSIWIQLGGHADGDPDLLAVALREAHEESGIDGIVADSAEIADVDIHDIPTHKSVPAHQHYDVRFVLRAPVGASFTVSDESHALAWVPRGDIEQYTQDVSVLRMARKLGC